MTEPIDRAAIKARAEAASAGPWELLGGGEYISPIGIIVAPDDGGVRPADAEFIAYAREDIPALLAALEEAEREVAKITENRNEWASRMMELATTEQKLERAERRIAAVEAIHRPAHAVFNWRTGLRYEDPCRGCDGKAGVHECGCWSDVDAEFVCRECDQPKNGGSRRVTPWPCPTRAALHPVAETTERGNTCPCAKCNPEAWWMILCPDCGNKRCPRAGWHEYECTSSNEYGQVGTPTTEKGNDDE